MLGEFDDGAVAGGPGLPDRRVECTTGSGISVAEEAALPFHEHDELLGSSRVQSVEFAAAHTIHAYSVSLNEEAELSLNRGRPDVGEHIVRRPSTINRPHGRPPAETAVSTERSVLGARPLPQAGKPCS